MTFRKRLSSKQREELYDAEAAKAQAAERGDLPICNICDLPVNGATQAWDESHQKHKPRWLGGSVEGISHRRCNRDWNNRHDTPLYAKSNRQRQKNIGARVPQQIIPGGIGDKFKKRMDGTVVLRSTNEPWRPGQ